jgi:transposase-like protein
MTQNRPLPLRLKDGKFYRGNEEVKPEFGNKEQIALIREAERIETMSVVMAKFESEEIITYQGVISFKCPVCQTDNRLKDTEIEEGDVSPSDFDNTFWKCKKCSTEFEAFWKKGMSHKEIELRYEKEESE